MKKLNKEEVSILRERFITKYCKDNGWDKKNLTTGQLLIIARCSDYITPKIKIK